MVDPSRLAERRWYERTLIAGMVVVGFAIGSVGLTVAAELLGEDPVLTDEFNAPVAEDEPTGIVAVAATTTQPPATTVPPAAVVPDTDTDRSGGDDERRTDRDGGRDREPSDRDEERDRRRRT